MTIYSGLIFACWLTLFGFWLISAFDAKRSIRGTGLWRQVYVRIAVALIVVLALHFAGGKNLLRHAGGRLLRDFMHGFIFPSAIARSIGVALCVSGVALAIWARIYLGRNWGMPMSFKDNPELVTSGPYAYIRHPIYTGFLTLLLGSVLASGMIWLVPFVIFTAYFIYSAMKEEKIMTQQFPDAYPDYRRRTKTLIPFVL